MESRRSTPDYTVDNVRIPEFGIGSPPDQTNAKSLLISHYLSLFQKVTRGGLYIDGFAAPQSRRHEEAWTARRVLEITPPRLRTLWLCDVDRGGLEQLRKLKKEHHQRPKSRRVFVMPGDFNQTIKVILKSPRLTRKAAIFALLDQRNTECHWETVRAIAARAGRMKIEQLYFFGSSWAHRSLKTSTTPERLAEIDLWWGDRSWNDLKEMSQMEMVDRLASRFQNELGYRFVKPYPVYQRENGKKKAFHLIHASDHEEAPKLMLRSYIKYCGGRAGDPGDTQQPLPF